jgi:hypothetical protein
MWLVVPRFGSKLGRQICGGVEVEIWSNVTLIVLHAIYTLILHELKLYKSKSLCQQLAFICKKIKDVVYTPDLNINTPTHNFVYVK